MKTVFIFTIYILLFILPVITCNAQSLVEKETNCLVYKNKIINCSDSNYSKYGYWMYFHNCNPSGIIYAEGLYRNGVKSGKWIYRKWVRCSTTPDTREVIYTDDGGVIFEMDCGFLKVNSDSSLSPDYSNCRKNHSKTWCHKFFWTNNYECFHSKNSHQSPNTYQKNMVQGLLNAIHEISFYEEAYLECILERKSDYYIESWYRRD